VNAGAIIELFAIVPADGTNAAACLEREIRHVLVYGQRSDKLSDLSK
jgi:hypothetical protein